MRSEELASRVIEQATAGDLSIVTAESCTAGGVAQVLSKVPGAGEHFLGGFVTYTKRMKSDVLAVRRSLLEAEGAVCEAVAKAMALGALEASSADVAVAVTGVAGPEPDEDGNPVGLIYVSAIRAENPAVTRRRMFEGMSRDGVIEAAIVEALDLLMEIAANSGHPSVSALRPKAK